MKDKFFLLIGVLVISGSFYQVLRLPAPERFQKEFALKTGEKVIAVEVADTEEERAKGLSGRDALAEGRGMLFIFPESGYHGFWMKNRGDSGCNGCLYGVERELMGAVS